MNGVNSLRCVSTHDNHATTMNHIGYEHALYGAPGWNRTSDPQLRRLMLYPTELRARFIFQRLTVWYVPEPSASVPGVFSWRYL